MENGSICKVINDFLSINEGEICLKKNDIVLVLKKVDRYWSYGWVNNNSDGNFPTSCVMELEIPQIMDHEKLFVALESFPGQQQGDLAFNKGELIVGVQEVDKNWWNGKIYERYGIFPITLVWEINMNLIKVSNKSQQINKKAVVLMDLKAQLDEEIDLYKGEIVTVTEICEDNWYRGTIGERSGIFPSSFVKIIDSECEEKNENIIFQNELLPAQENKNIVENEFSNVNQPSISNTKTNNFNISPDLFDDDYFKINLSDGYNFSKNIPKSPSLEVDIVPYAFTLYPFCAQFENELSFAEGEIVNLIRHIDSDWIEGSIDGRKGIFPANYVNIVIDCNYEGAFKNNELGLIENRKKQFLENSTAIVLYKFDAQMEGDLSINEGQIVLILENTGEEWCKVVNQDGKSGLCPKNYLEPIDDPNSKQNIFQENLKQNNEENLEKFSYIKPSIAQKKLIFESPKEKHLSTEKEISSDDEIIEKEKETSGHIPFERQNTIQRRTPHRPVPPVPISGQSPLKRNRNNISPTLNNTQRNSEEASNNKIELAEQNSSCDLKKKRSELRQNLISELVFTEKEYIRDLKITYETFNLHNPRELEARGVNVKCLFGNILEVIQVAETFLDSLLFGMKGKDESEQCVGPCFISIADKLRDTYGFYCMNHDNALLILEKYEANEEIKRIFEKGLESLRYQIACFNMGSILIKPVQRILKYPLILNELIKATEDYHIDKKFLIEAAKIIIDVASYINEDKRRKDIVSKYLDDGSDTLSSRISRISFHSVAKKSSRFGVYITSTLGFASVTKDAVFDEHESMFHRLEKTIRFFIKNSESFISILHDDLMNEQFLAETLSYFYHQPSIEVDYFKNIHRRISYSYWSEFKTTIANRVYEPLNHLLELFEGPYILILKRHDKLLDYGACLSKTEKTRDSKIVQEELSISKNNYEALNTQLIEELPLLINTALELFNECLAAFVTARKLLCGKITNQYLNLIQTHFPETIKEDLIDLLGVKQSLIYNQLRRFSLSNKSLVEQKPENNPKSLPQSPNQKIFLRSTFNENFLYIVKEDFISNEAMELTMNRGDLVAIIKKQDPMGNTDRWFVHNGVSKGFLPSSILKPATSSPRERCNSSLSVSSQRSDRVRTPENDPSENVKEFDDKPPPSYEDVVFSKHKTEKVTDESDSAEAKASQPEFYFADCDFNANGEYMLSIKKGQIINVCCKHDLEGNNEWWLVEDRYGKRGYVPGNHLLPYKTNSKSK